MPGVEVVGPRGDMGREMREQAAAVARVLAAAGDRGPQLAARLAGAELVLLLGRGSSRAAALYGAHVLQALCGLPAFALSPTGLGRRGARLPLDRALVVCISQSGESRELIEAAERVPRERLLVVTNASESALAALVPDEAVLDCEAGAERAVPATKTLTTSMAWLLGLAAAVAPGVLDTAVATLPGLIAEAVEGPPLGLVDPAAQGIVLAGEGIAEAVALEGAIKLSETLRRPAAAFEASDLLHGSVNMIGSETAVLAVGLDAVGRDLAARVVEAASMRGAATAYLGVAPGPAAGRTVTLPSLPPEVLALAVLPYLQRAAHDTALLAGLDPDRPVGLSKITDVGAPDLTAA